MFTFEVNKNNIELTEAETITSGSVNIYFCNFVFSPDWDGLAKTITFRAGDVSISVILDSTNMCTIPWEVLQADAVQLYAGVRGTVTATDTEEEAIIPTTYCLLGTIRKGAELGENAQPPLPSVVDQLTAKIEALDEGKQDKLVGTVGQVVSFDEFGNVIAREEKGTEYKAGENISISADNVISAAMYDDTEMRGEINSVKSKTEANTAGIAANAGAIAANSEGIAANAADIEANAADITKNSADIEKNKTDIAGNAANIAKNSADIAKNTAGLKTVGDKVDTLNTSLSTLSSSVTDNTAAITTAEENIAALSLSVTEAGQEIAKNASGLSAANTKISELSASKQDKLHGVEGQVVGFDADGNAIAQTGGSGTPGRDGTTFTPMVSPEGVISWTNDGGKENPEAVNIKGEPGPRGVTFTPTVSPEGIISWSNDGGLDNPTPANIKGPAGAYTAGDNIIIKDNVISAVTYDDTAIRSSISTLTTNKQDKLATGAGISINNDTISLSDTASTKKLVTGSLTSFGGVTVTSVNGFTLNRQTSNLSLISEYIHTDATSYTEFETYYGYLEAYITADADKTLSTTVPLYLNMSHSISFPGAVGFAIIKVSTMSRYIAMAESSGGIIRLYPTESVSVTSGKNITVYLYLR